MHRLRIPIPVQQGAAQWAFSSLREPARPLRLLLDRGSLYTGFADDMLLRFVDERLFLEMIDLPEDWHLRFRHASVESLGLEWNSPWRHFFRIAELDGRASVGSEDWPTLYCAAWGSVSGADILVTRDARLLKVASDYPVSTVNPMTPRAALGYVGLYLRSVNNFTLCPGQQILNRWMFYWVLTRSLLAEGWGWFSACLGSGREDLAQLSQSVLTRMDHALRARDRMLTHLHMREGNDSTEELLMGFDHMVLCMAACFDASARVIQGVENVVYARRPSWTDHRWLAALRQRNAALSDVFMPGSKAAMALDLLTTLRNQVHAESLAAGSATSAQEGEMDPVLFFLSIDAPRVVRLLDRLGIRCTSFPGSSREVLIDIAQCSEVLLIHTIAGLNGIMRATNLEAVCARSRIKGPPSRHDRDFGIRTQYRARLLAGLPVMPFATRSLQTQRSVTVE